VPGGPGPASRRTESSLLMITVDGRKGWRINLRQPLQRSDQAPPTPPRVRLHARAERMWFATTVARTDETWHRLLQWTYGQAPSERLSYQLLAFDGYTHIDPSHPLGGKDGGKDAIVYRGAKRYVMAAYFPRGQQSIGDIKRKFLGDLDGVRANHAVGIVFVTNQEISLSERRDLAAVAKPAKVDLFHLERVTQILDDPRMAQVRQQYLGIESFPLAEVERRIQSSLREQDRGVRRQFDNLRQDIQNSRGDEFIKLLPPYVRERVESLRAAHVNVGEIVRALASLPTLMATITRWINHPPTWLVNAPEGTWGLLAEITATFGSAKQAITVLKRTVQESTVDYSYWKGRLLLQALEHEGQEAAATLSAQFSTSEPIHPVESIATALAVNNFTTSQTVAQAWTPDTDRDKDLRAAVLVRCYVESDDVDQSIRVLAERVSSSNSANLRLQLARFLLVKAQTRGPQRDLRIDEALRYATDARDRLRSWGLDSSEAVATATDALLLIRDWAGAWNLVREPPEGIATAIEAHSDCIRTRAARIAAITGRREVARQIASTLSEFDRALIEATINEIDLADDADSTESAAQWQQVWDLAVDTEQQMVAARGLAVAGAPRPAAISALLDADPKFAEEYTRIASVAPQHGEKRNSLKARLRGQRRSNIYAAVRLAEILQAENRIDEAAQILAEAADVHGDQNLRLMAAFSLQQAEKSEESARFARDALARATARWTGRRRAWEILHDLAVEGGDWESAAAQARYMLGEEPDDEVARWCLVAALYQAGRVGDAWQVMNDPVMLPAPKLLRNRVLRLELLARYGNRQDVWNDAADIVRSSLEDERIAAHVLLLAYSPFERIGESERRSDTASTLPSPSQDKEAIAELHAATKEFAERYPSSQFFRMVSVNPEDPASSMEALVKETQRGQSKNLESVLKAGLPLGMVAAVAGRPYSEIILRRGLGVLSVRSPVSAEREAEMTDLLSIQLETEVLIDAAALSVVSMLSEQAAVVNATDSTEAKLLGAIDRCLAADVVVRDVLRARDALKMMSPLSVAYDFEREALVIGEEDEDELARIANRADTMLSFAHSLPPTTLNLAAKEGRGSAAGSEAWLGLIESCSATGRGLWSDDLALRRLARSEGVPTFGTTTVLDLLRKSDVVTEEEYEASILQLGMCFVVDLPLTLQALQLMAIADGWRPGSAATFLSRKWSWSASSSTCQELFLEAVGHNLGNPRALHVWTGKAVEGLMALDVSPAQAKQNLTVFLTSLLQMPASTPTCLAAMIDGARFACGDLLEDSWRDALIGLHRSLLKEGFSWNNASGELVRRASGLPNGLRLVALSVALRVRP
jgi:tetratricopeptide (TPR) repeat protein